MATEFYDALIAAAAPGSDASDVHVLACILAIGAEECRRGRMPSLSAAVGLDDATLRALFRRLFPNAAVRLNDFALTPVARADDEACLVDLLRQATTSGWLAAEFLAPMIARRAQRPDHLWQDLGLRARTELSALMARHFRVLAARNTRDMKWKKYLYRTICGDAGYTLCTAPSCAECADFGDCFGDESGESFLARMRRDGKTAAA